MNRLLRLAKLSKNLKYVELVIKFNPAFGRILKIFTIMLLMCHWLGCAWFFVGDVELSQQDLEMPVHNDWQPSAELLHSNSLGAQFANAFFWGAGMVTASKIR